MSTHRAYESYARDRSRHGETNDCTVIATAVVTGIGYDNAHALLKAAGRRKGRGLSPPVYHKAIRDLGFTIVNVYEFARPWNRQQRNPDHAHLPSITSKTVRTIERELAEKYGGCKLMIGVSGHVLAWDGEKIVDWSIGRLKRVQDVYIVFPNDEIPTPHRCDKLIEPHNKHFGKTGTVSYFFRTQIYQGTPKETILKVAREQYNPDIPDSYYKWYVNDCKKKKLI